MILIDLIKDTAIKYYTYIFGSLLMAFLAMFAVMFIRKYGVRNSVRYILAFLKSKKYRSVFIFAVYISLMLSRTILFRPLIENSFAELTIGWDLRSEDGEPYTSGLENVVLFIPYTFLAIRTGRIWKGRTEESFIGILKDSFIMSAVFSVSIEVFQAIFCVGLLQLSDLCFNISGGIAGGVLYRLFYMRRDKS